MFGDNLFLTIVFALTVFGTLGVLALIAGIIVHGGNRDPYPTKDDDNA